jgi:hypothetical protein
MSEAERIRLTARRVGLDVPLAYDASNETNTNYRDSATLAQDEYGRDKARKEDQLYSGRGDGINGGGPLPPPVPKV